MPVFAASRGARTGGGAGLMVFQQALCQSRSVHENSFLGSVQSSVLITVEFEGGPPHQNIFTALLLGRLANGS